jgi:hypothetical protein
MFEHLNIDLENLRKEVAKKDRAVVVLSQPALERQFHGLTLGQIVKLTDAPVLATVAELLEPDSGRRERFCVDGKDPEALPRRRPPTFARPDCNRASSRPRSQDMQQ